MTRMKFHHLKRSVRNTKVKCKVNPQRNKRIYRSSIFFQPEAKRVEQHLFGSFRRGWDQIESTILLVITGQKKSDANEHSYFLQKRTNILKTVAFIAGKKIKQSKKFLFVFPLK